MLTDYTFCKVLKSKLASEVVQVYIENTYMLSLVVETCILSDSCTKFKSPLFEDVARQLRVEYKVHTSLIIHNQMAGLIGSTFSQKPVYPNMSLEL